MFSVSSLGIRRVSMGLGPSPLGFFSSSVPVWTAFPYPLTRVRIPAASDYYAPSDSCKDIGVSCGLPLLYSPLPFPFLEGLPCSRHRTYLWMALRWRVHLRVPSPLWGSRSEEHTSELQSRLHLVCRLLLEKKKKNTSRPLPNQSPADAE